MVMKTYSANDVSLIIAGVPVDSGRGESTFVEIQIPERFVLQRGCDGECTRAPTNDTTATATVTLTQSSSGNALLSALHSLDLAAPAGGAGVGPFMLKDGSGTSLYAAPHCYIIKSPDAAFGGAPGERQWQLQIIGLEAFCGGN